MEPNPYEAPAGGPSNRSPQTASPRVLATIFAAALLAVLALAAAWAISTVAYYAIVTNAQP